MFGKLLGLGNLDLLHLNVFKVKSDPTWILRGIDGKYLVNKDVLSL